MAEARTAMIVSDTNRFVFVAIPKTGTYSVHAALGHAHNHPEPELHHAGIAKILHDNPQAADYFKFAFVRNPWDKLVSMYHDFTLRRGCQYSGEITYDQPLLSEFKDFEDFCLNLKDSHWLTDVFFKPQYSFLVTDEGMVMDLVWKFEDMQRGFEMVCKAIPCPPQELAHLNQGQYQGKYREHYTTRAADAVGELYDIDVSTFRYEF